MNTLTALARLEQRQALRRRLFLQRLRIGHLLTPQVAADNQFPRSMTMRLLTQRPAVAMRLAQAYDLDLRAFSGDADKGSEADLQEVFADVHLRGRKEVLPVSRSYLHVFRQM